MRSSRSWKRAPPIRPKTRSITGWVYQDPRKMAIRPRGGSTRQNRHMGGRIRSSSEGSLMAWVSMPRASSHSCSRLTVLVLPAPSTPPTSTTTPRFDAASSRCAASSAARSAGTCSSYAALPIF